MNRSLFGFASLAVLALIAPGANAQTGALNFTGNSLSGTTADSVRGFAFDVSGTGFTVTYLSFFDSGADGLVQTHNIGLWDPSGVLLTSTSIAAGTVASLDDTGKFRLVNVAPVFLAPSSGYIVGATFLNGSTDSQAGNLVNISVAPNLAYGGTRFINNTPPDALVRPTNTLAATGLPGGSFGGVAGNVAAAPEPASLALLLVGVVALRRRRATA